MTNNGTMPHSTPSDGNGSHGRPDKPIDEDEVPQTMRYMGPKPPKFDVGGDAPPSLRSDGERLARAGDVAGLYELIGCANWSMEDHRKAMRLLRLAIAIAGQKDPSAFSDLISQRMAVFSAHLLLRMQLQVERLLSDDDGRSPERILSREFEAVLGLFAQMQRQNVEMEHIQAKTKRVNAWLRLADDQDAERTHAAANRKKPRTGNQDSGNRSNGVLDDPAN